MLGGTSLLGDLWPFSDKGFGPGLDGTLKARLPFIAVGFFSLVLVDRVSHDVNRVSETAAAALTATLLVVVIHFAIVGTRLIRSR
jgi:hypothetical protein